MPAAVVGWAWLLLAIGLEVFGTTCLKLSDQFSRLWPSVGVTAGYVGSFVALSLALKTFEVGTAYAIWSGIGTAAIVIVGYRFLGESLGPMKVGGIALIIVGVVVLNLARER
jgi:small multidrug resistance pump